MQVHNSTELEGYRALFNQFDQDHDGRINVNDMCNLLRSLGENPTPREVIAMIHKIGDDDYDYDAICFPDFLNFLTAKRGNEEKDFEIKHLFSIIDTDGDGFISPEEFRYFLTKF